MGFRDGGSGVRPDEQLVAGQEDRHLPAVPRPCSAHAAVRQSLDDGPLGAGRVAADEQVGTALGAHAVLGGQGCEFRCAGLGVRRSLRLRRGGAGVIALLGPGEPAPGAPQARSTHHVAFRLRRGGLPGGRHAEVVGPDGAPADLVGQALDRLGAVDVLRAAGRPVLGGLLEQPPDDHVVVLGTDPLGIGALREHDRAVSGHQVRRGAGPDFGRSGERGQQLVLDAHQRLSFLCLAV